MIWRWRYIIVYIKANCVFLFRLRYDNDVCVVTVAYGAPDNRSSELWISVSHDCFYRNWACFDDDDNDSRHNILSTQVRRQSKLSFLKCTMSDNRMVYNCRLLVRIYLENEVSAI